MSNLMQLKNDIEKLPKEKHIEILNILYKKNDVNISENNNGTFINLCTIDEKTIQELKTYILYLQEQEKKFAKDEILKLNMEKSLNKDNKEQTSNNILNVAY
jgi:hypothetical protein